MHAGEGPARDQASLAQHGGKLYCFGGTDSAGAATNTLYMLDISCTAAKWQALATTGSMPCPRQGVHLSGQHASPAMQWAPRSLLLCQRTPNI